MKRLFIKCIIIFVFMILLFNTPVYSANINIYDPVDTVNESTFVSDLQEHVSRYFTKEDTKPVNGVIKSYYSNSQLHYVMPCIDGYADGEYELYFENGNRWRKTVYKKGLRVGLDITYYQHKKDAILRSIEYFDGKKHGEWLTYTQKGEIVSRTMYSNAVRHGYSYSYDEKGVITGESHYKNGKTHGKTFSLDSQYNYAMIGYYADDEQLLKVIYHE